MLALAGWCVGWVATGCGSPPPKALEPVDGVERRMSAGEVHAYTLSLRRAQFVEWVVEQHGIDVSIMLIDPSGLPILEVDSPNGDQGREVLLAVAEEGGDYGVEIRAGSDQSSGRYVPRVLPPRPATAQDRHRAAAALALARGERLLREIDAERADEVLEEAHEALLESVELWRAAGDARGEALSLHWIARVLSRRGQPAAELTTYVEAVEAARGARDDRLTAILLHRVGRIHYAARRNDAALASFGEAGELFKGLGDRLRHARLLNRIALTRQAMGESQTAIRVYSQALGIFQSLGDGGAAAVVRRNIGDAYFSLAQMELALDHYVPLREHYRRTGDVEQEAATLISIGRVYRRRDELLPARGYFEQALALLRGLDEEALRKSRRRLALVLGDLGQCDFKLGNFDRALAAYRDAVTIAREIGDAGIESITRINIGWLYERSGELEKALAHYRAALPLLERRNDRHGLAAAAIGIAKTEHKRGDLRAAIVYARRAVAAVEALREESDTPSFRASYFAAKRDYYERLIDLLLELDRQEPGAGYSARALAISERSRARSLVDSLAESGVGSKRQVPAQLMARERETLERLKAADLARVLWQAGEVDGVGRTAVDRELRRAVAEYRDIQGLLLSHRKIADPSGFEPPSLAEIQGELLDAETVLLEYSLGDETSHLWLVSPSSIECFELPGRARIEPLARRAHRLLAQSHLPGVEQQARLVLEDLGAMLLGAAHERLNGRRLVIVAEGALHYVPFGALLIRPGGAEPRPLSVFHEIVSLPSLTVLERLRQRAARRPAARALAVVADPVFVPDDARVRRLEAALEPSPSPSRSRAVVESYGRLPASAEEAKALLELVEPGLGLYAGGFDANLNLVRSGALADFRRLHFATHGRIQTDVPELSGLVLSLVDEAGRHREGILYAYEIYRLHLPADLVVLSACQTALGQEVRGEGLINLTRGFFYAGARRVVVSLWRVDDRATAAFMRQFYRAHLTGGHSAGVALRTAQAAMREDSAWHAPYYWAGFVLQGDWR